MKRWIIFIVFISAFPLKMFPQETSFSKPGGWVSDFAGVVPFSYKEKMEILATEVKHKTGVELAVVTVENMRGLTVEDYATQLFQNWGIGEKGKDNGALILLALQERKVRIEVGYDLEAIIPDGVAGEILDRYVLPDLRTGDYGNGLYKGLIAIASVVAKDQGVQITGTQSVLPRARVSERGGRGGTAFFIIILILLMILTKGRILPWLFLGAMMSGGRGGGFSGGSGFGGGFGGFGGGLSGGGGASRGF